MSIHLETVTLDMDRIDNAISIDNLSNNSRGVDFKVKTQVSDMDMLESIIEDKLLGFKNKRALMEFQDNGDMFFYFENNSDTISIAFFGDFPKNDTIMFINNLNREYLTLTNQLYSYKEIAYDTELSENTVQKESITIKIKTNMKNKSIIESIINSSFLGYNTQKEVDEFKNKGIITLNKADDSTYDVIFIGDYKTEEVESFVNNIYDEYKAKIQEITYEKLLEKIKDNNYSIDSEVIDNNDSIVVTVNID